jgi:hypothetical protein
MNEQTFTVDDVTKLLNTVMAGTAAAGNLDIVGHTLEEVAAMTKFSLRELELDCRARPPRIEHTRRGRKIVLTSRQIALLMSTHRVATDAATATPTDDLAEARRASARSGAARSGRKLAS